jgi:hypothetical protein
MQYEKKISDLTLEIQKMERDINFKDEELKSIKSIARDVAEYAFNLSFMIYYNRRLEPVKQREEEFKQYLLEKELIIK